MKPHPEGCQVRELLQRLIDRGYTSLEIENLQGLVDLPDWQFLNALSREIQLALWEIDDKIAHEAQKLSGNDMSTLLLKRRKEDTLAITRCELPCKAYGDPEK